jgi:DNA primase
VGDQTVALKFRADPNDRHGTKYMALPGQHPRLFNVAALRGEERVVAIVEGELDAIVMTHTVGVPAIGVPGAGTWLKHHRRCFADADQVFIVTDNDTGKKDNAGQRLALKVAEDLRGSKIVTPPAGMDVTDWVVAEGVDAVRERLGL